MTWSQPGVGFEPYHNHQFQEESILILSVVKLDCSSPSILFDSHNRHEPAQDLNSLQILSVLYQTDWLAADCHYDLRWEIIILTHVVATLTNVCKGLVSKHHKSEEWKSKCQKRSLSCCHLQERILQKKTLFIRKMGGLKKPQNCSVRYDLHYQLKSAVNKRWISSKISESFREVNLFCPKNHGYVSSLN